MIFPLVHYIRRPSSTIRYERLAMLLVVFFLKKWNQRKTLRRRLHAWVVSSYRNNFRHQFVIQIKPFKLALFVIYFQKRILWAKFKTPVLLYLSTKMVKTFYNYQTLDSSDWKFYIQLHPTNNLQTAKATIQLIAFSWWIEIFT